MVSCSRSSARAREEARDGDAAAFDEQPVQPARRERRADRRGIEARAGARQAHQFGLAAALARARAVRGGEQQGRRGGVAEDAVARVEAPLRVDHHPHRMVAGTAPHGKLGIVVQHGARAHQNGIDEGAHAMGVQQVLVAADPARRAAGAGDPAVEALREMGDGERALPSHGDERPVEREERRRANGIGLRRGEPRRRPAPPPREQRMPGGGLGIGDVRWCSPPALFHMIAASSPSLVLMARGSIGCRLATFHGPGTHDFASGAMPPPLLLGAAGQLALLGAGLALAAHPLGWRGWGLALALYGVIGALVLRGLGHHAPHRRFGFANGVTAARAAAATLLLGVWAEAALGGLLLAPPLRWGLAGIAAAALASDGVDGWLARRRGLASDFGARFDMETDALLVVALALLVFAAGQAGAFVLLSGLLRYLFAAAGALVPALRAPLPPSRRRKIVCVAQTALLIVALVPWIAAPAGAMLCAVGLALLLSSFAADCAGMLSGRRGSPIMRRQEPQHRSTCRPIPPLPACERCARSITPSPTCGAARWCCSPMTAPNLVLEAAETLTSEGLARLARLTGRQLSLALTRRRAAILGWVPPAVGPGGTVIIPIPEGSEVEFLRDLADPTASAGSPVALGPATVAQEAADAAVELTKLARLLPAVMMGPVGDRAAAGLAADGIHAVRAADIRTYQQSAAQSLRPVAEARVPLVDAENTRIIAFRPSDGGTGHIAIVIGDPDPAQPLLLRLHSECFTGDLLGSLRCDCGDQLRGAIAEIARAGSGLLLYLAQEGRGIGLVNKLRAYNLQDAGLDTFDANEQLGFDADERVYLPAAEILRQLGFGRVRLMTNNPDKVAALTRCGITVVERVPHVFPANSHNERYLHAKATRHGHLL